MQKKTLTRRLGVFALFILLAAITACSPRSGGLLATTRKEVSDHWTQTVRLETQITAQHTKLMVEVNSGFSTLQLNNTLLEKCYENPNEVIINGMAGGFNSVGDDGTLTNDMAIDNIVSAFAPTLAYAGSTAVCEAQLAMLAEEIRAWNADKSDNSIVLADMLREYQNHISDSITKSFALDFAQYAEQKAMEAGLSYKGYVYPTDGLRTQTADEAVCSYYAQTDVRGDCEKTGLGMTLVGQAALDYISRPFISSTVQSAFDRGNDDLNPFEQ